MCLHTHNGLNAHTYTVWYQAWDTQAASSLSEVTTATNTQYMHKHVVTKDVRQDNAMLSRCYQGPLTD
jgi:hypothetical protein